MKIADIKSLHLELTSLCNATCPMCMRTGFEKYYDKDFSNINILKETIGNISNQLKHVYFCGSSGDPLASKHLLDICSFIKNQNVWISIHTNGGLRNPNYYVELSQYVDRIVFSIDGLQDTNDLYRVNVSWDKVIENAKAFISTGKIAEWHYLVFKHNEHQIEQARDLAYSLGFKKFVVKKSSRFRKDNLGNALPYEANNNRGTYKLEYSTLDLKDAKVIKDTTLDCFSLHQGELYIDHLGHILPCCYLGVDLLKSLRQDNAVEITEFKTLGDIKDINLNHNSLEQILNSEFFKRLWLSSQNLQLKTCNTTCLKKIQQTQYKDLN